MTDIAEKANGTDLNKADTDGDGINDSGEKKDDTYPLNPASYRKVKEAGTPVTSKVSRTKAPKAVKQLPKTGDSKGTVGFGALLLLASFGLAAKKRKNKREA